MQLNDIEQKFFALLRLSLMEEEAVDDATKRVLKTICPTDWSSLYRMSERQTLVAVIFRGVCRLPSSLYPPRPLVLRWISYSEQIKHQNMRADACAVKALTTISAAGLRCCLLKGQGNALMYPDPRMRTSGDIDAWTDAGDLCALRYVESVQHEVDFCYHHVELPHVDGLPVELHYRPAFLQNFRHDKRLQTYFTEHADEQFSNIVELPDGAGQIAVPTPSFNRIFQLCHIVNHFGHEGIGLRQIIDYYYVLRQGFSEEEKKADYETLKATGMLHFARGLIYILNEFLGLESRYLLVEPDARMGSTILHETLCGGNFGHHDTRIYAKTGNSTVGRNFFRLLRDIRLWRHYPSELLFEPIFRLWHYGWRQRMKKRLKQ